MQPIPSRSNNANKPSSIHRSNMLYFGWWMMHGVPNRRKISTARCISGGR